MTTRTNVYIDGFNFYYGAIKGGPCKWLDLQSYFIKLRPDDKVGVIHYFTALMNGGSLNRQQMYLRALATTPLVNITLGKFKPKSYQCKVVACSHAQSRVFVGPSEKRTDVNIALQMLEDGFLDRCDTFVLVSGDSDLVPAVDRVRALFPEKRVVVYIPTRDKNRGAAVELRAAASKSRD